MTGHSVDRGAGPDEPGALEEAAGERLGVERWDRPTVFRETADAAVDNGLLYWLVLVLSGAIATFGLALNSTAIVIGAMLVAPVLGPIMGLSLALAVGDARLALQSFAVVAGSLVAVVVTAAVLTELLPFQTLTLEISSRIHPTTLDLGVAICSGLVGALVTVARGHRLSAAIPGVAVAVALIPPLAVAGFGMAAAWQADVIWGALLLLGANLAGIVLSGVAVFLLIGMHRTDVVAAARQWHETATPNGIARLIARVPGFQRAGVFGSAAGRTTLVVMFVLALAIPLTAALGEVVREARVRGAVENAIDLLESEGTSVLWRQVDIGPDSTLVRVRVATAVGVDGALREEFQRRATELAGEPVYLRLQQLPVSGDASALQALLRGGGGQPERGAEGWPETLEEARTRLESAVWSLPFPAGADAVAVTLHVESDAAAGSADSVMIAYLAPDTLTTQTTEVLGVALRRAVGHAELRTSFQHAGPARTQLLPDDTAGISTLMLVLRRYPRLRASVIGADADSAATRSIVEALRAAGLDSVRTERRSDGGPVELRLHRSADGN